MKTEKALLGLPVVCIHHGCYATTISQLYSKKEKLEAIRMFST